MYITVFMHNMLYEVARRPVSLVRIQSSVGEYKYTLHSFVGFGCSRRFVRTQNPNARIRVFECVFLCACVYVCRQSKHILAIDIYYPQGVPCIRSRVSSALAMGGFFGSSALSTAAKMKACIPHRRTHATWSRMAHISHCWAGEMS